MSSNKTRTAKWRPGWIAFYLVIVTASAVTALAQTMDSADDVTGTVSKVEPQGIQTIQDGTPIHPFADASQCPPSTDLVMWPKSGHSIPTIPSDTSVCFVGDQSFNSSGTAGPMPDR